MTKTVAVIAANGRSGRACVDALLGAGYRVRAGVHRAGAEVQHPSLVVQACDATSADDIATLLSGADVVVSMLGRTRRSATDVQTRATQLCIAYMTNHPTMRFISLTGTGVRQVGDHIGLADWLGNFIIGLIDPARIRDGVCHAKLLEQSPINYTVLRVLKLTNGRHAGTVRLTPHGPVELFTPRARVAAAVVRVIEGNDFARTTPVISGVE